MHVMLEFVLSEAFLDVFLNISRYAITGYKIYLRNYD